MTEIDLQALYSPVRCFWCEGLMFDRAKLEPYPDLLYRFRQRIVTRDHLIPLREGGAGYTVAACLRCNQQKGSQDPMRFRDNHRPDISVEKVAKALLAAKLAHALIVPKTAFRKKRVTRRPRVVK